MAAFTVNSKFLSVSFNDTVFISLNEDRDIVKLKLEVSCENYSKNVEDTERQIVCSVVSPCRKFLAICTNKHMSIWRTSDWFLINKRTLTRIASKIIFTPKSESLIVADKSGDVYKYNVLRSDEPGILLLGHLSVILDVLICPNESFILTCDRDEKIRVSHYPNSYSIHCYCLGHEEFVTSLNFLPHNEDILISGSGDGTLRLWNYLEGTVILTYSCKKDTDNQENEMCPVLHVSTATFEKYCSLVCVTVGNFRGILVYTINDLEQGYVCLLKQVIQATAEMCSMAIDERNLFVLFKEKKDFLKCYSWSEVDSCFKKSTSNFAMSLNKIEMIGDKLENLFRMDMTFTQLYKKKFHNLNEYLERKQARLKGGNESKSKKAKFINS